MTRDEFEQLMRNDPMDMDYRFFNGEERYRSVGLTDGGRFLTVAWTIRGDKLRPVTAFRASVPNRKTFLASALVKTYPLLLR